MFKDIDWTDVAFVFLGLVLGMLILFIVATAILTLPYGWIVFLGLLVAFALSVLIVRKRWLQRLG